MVTNDESFEERAMSKCFFAQFSGRAKRIYPSEQDGLYPPCMYCGLPTQSCSCDKEERQDK